jgi:hypothetical protein
MLNLVLANFYDKGQCVLHKQISGVPLLIICMVSNYTKLPNAPYTQYAVPRVDLMFQFLQDFVLEVAHTIARLVGLCCAAFADGLNEPVWTFQARLGTFW